MYYTLYQNKQKNSSAYMKYYACPAKGHTKTIDDMAKIIQRNCSMKHSDVIAVLKEMQVVIFDEYHERSINSDLSLALTRLAKNIIRPDLKKVSLNIIYMCVFSFILLIFAL